MNRQCVWIPFEPDTLCWLETQRHYSSTKPTNRTSYFTVRSPYLKHNFYTVQEGQGYFGYYGIISHNIKIKIKIKKEGKSTFVQLTHSDQYL